MKLFLDGHHFQYEMSNLCFLFFPGEQIEAADCVHGEAARRAFQGDCFVYTRIVERGGRISALVMIKRDGRCRKRGERFDSAGREDQKQSELALARAFYMAARELTGLKPPWGILTGIRPVKLVRGRLRDGLSPDGVTNEFASLYYTNPEKTRLCITTAGTEDQILSLSRPESASLYISIPFCPSRCLYCSFISHDVEKSAKLLPEYVRLLCREIEETGVLFRSLGLRLETVYMGGGTPTSLSAGQLSEIFGAVSRSFNLGTAREYTVEAGRPDTITAEKLAAIAACGATRISINPQTMDDAVLRRIGRLHSARDVVDAYTLARAAKIKAINMDLIAGLPGDTPDGFQNTLRQILSLKPEAITVHTLAMKRSSRLVTSGNAVYSASGTDTSLMLESAADSLSAAGYLPYYLYRQKNMVGNLENVGWSLPGHEGLYNVYIMDETHSVLAVGAGGVTKMRQPGGGRIERVFNFKYPYEYIARFGEILDRKKQVKEFYAEYGFTVSAADNR